MNKKIIITLSIIILMVLAGYIISLLFTNNDVKATPTDKEICYGTGSTFEEQITACGNIIKESQRNYALTVSQLSGYAESASGVREKIRVVAKDFYDKNLSGTNVDFQ